MNKEILKALPSWIVLTLAKFIMIILGILIFPIGYFLLRHEESPDKGIILNYPKYLWPWGNDRDGFLGDGPWIAKRRTPFGLPVDHPFSMFVWSCLRNPCNNAFKFARGISCYVKNCTVSLIAGQEFVRDKEGSEGWQFVKADGPVFNYWGFYLVSKRSLFGRRLLIRIGHKIEPRHNDTDWSLESDQKAWKGFTFRIGLQRI